MARGDFIAQSVPGDAIRELEMRMQVLASSFDSFLAGDLCIFSSFRLLFAFSPSTTGSMALFGSPFLAVSRSPSLAIKGIEIESEQPPLRRAAHMTSAMGEERARASTSVLRRSRRARQKKANEEASSELELGTRARWP